MNRILVLISVVFLIFIMYGCIESQQPLTNTLVTQENKVEKYVINSSENNQTNQNGMIENSKCEINKVYFIYADWCPHCQKMKPLVSQLESEGYLFVKINSQDSSQVKIAKECLSGIAQLKYIPEFVCISNRKSHVGGFSSIEEMREFVAACNGIK